MIVFVPALVKVIVRVAVPPADVVVVAGTGVTATGAPICTPALKKVTVPVVPVALLLLEVMVAVSATGIAVVTPDAGLAAKADT